MTRHPEAASGGQGRCAVRLRRLAAASLGVIMVGSAHGGAAEAPLAFTEEAAVRGVDYAVGFSGGAAGWGPALADLDGDGDPDLVAVGRSDGLVGLWENDGSGHFTSRSATSGIPALTQTSGVLALDVDGDGDLDLLIVRFALASRLYRNDGGMTFTDVTSASGMGTGTTSCTGCCAADFDGDGDLDVSMARYGVANRLMQNDGSGLFTDVAVAAGVADPWNGWQTVALDADGDGDDDLYVSNDKKVPSNTTMRNRLYRNDGGMLFTEISAGSGTDVNAYSMGVAVGDLDGNGLEDLYCTNLMPEPSPLCLSQGGGVFLQAAASWGVTNDRTGWGTVLFDWDNDGLQDLYVCNFDAANRLYRNLGNGTMEDVAPQVAAAIPFFSHCSAAGDVDGDGDVDLVVQVDGSPLRLLINQEGSRRHWLRLQVEGAGPNTAAVGAKAAVRTGAAWQYRWVRLGGNGFKGQNELCLHLGLGDAMVAEEATVTWPDGSVRTLTSLPADRAWRVPHPSKLGDADRDGDVDLLDFRAMRAGLSSPFQPGDEPFDLDGDFTLGAADVALLLERWDRGSWPVQDCDGDGTPDPLAIALDPGLDLDMDGLLDGCGLQSADFNGDGRVNGADLALLLGHWGDPTCPADLTGDGSVGGADLGILIAQWTG